MSLKIVFNALTGEFDLVNNTTTTATIQRSFAYFIA